MNRGNFALTVASVLTVTGLEPAIEIFQAVARFKCTTREKAQLIALGILLCLPIFSIIGCCLFNQVAPPLFRKIEENTRKAEMETLIRRYRDSFVT